MADINDPRNAPASKINEALASLSGEMAAMRKDVAAVGAEVAGVSRGIVAAPRTVTGTATAAAGRTAAGAADPVAELRKVQAANQQALETDLQRLAAIKAQTAELARQQVLLRNQAAAHGPAGTLRAAEEVAAQVTGSRLDPAGTARVAATVAAASHVQNVSNASIANQTTLQERLAATTGKQYSEQLATIRELRAQLDHLLATEGRRATAAAGTARALDYQRTKEDALFTKTRDSAIMGGAEGRQARADMANPLSPANYQPRRGFPQFPVQPELKSYPGLPVTYVNQGPQFQQRRNSAEWEAQMGGRTAGRDIERMSQDLTRLGTVQAAASQQMRRHGALTTEFLTALARGETTLSEFGWQIQATAGKFAGWTAAAAGVYGLVNALGHVRQGAMDASSGVNVVNRVVTDGFKGADAQDAFVGLSKQFNVPINTAVDAVYRMGQRFHSLPEAVEAAKASLYSFKTGEVDVATSTENLLAIVNGFHLGAKDLAGVYDQINQAQNTFGIRIGDTEAGLAKAAGTYRNAGGDLNYLLAIMTAIGRATNRSGQEIGTGIARGVNEIRKPINQAKLEAQGVTVDPGNFQKTLQSGLAAAQRGGDLQQIASGLFGNQYARLIAPVLADQTTLNKALHDTSPEASKNSAQKELAKVLGEVNEQVTQLGNGLERIGALMAESHAFDGFGVMLHSLNALIGATEHFLSIINDIPEPFRQVLIPLAEMTLALRLLRRTRLSEGIADATGLSFLGPKKGESARREAIIGTRAAEQSAANAFEGAINSSQMSKVEAVAQRRLGEELRLEAERTTNVITRTELNERANAAIGRSAALEAQSYAQEQIALQYQEAYTAAIEKRVALQKRTITAEEALVGTAAAFPGGVTPVVGKTAAKKGATAAEAAVASGFWQDGVYHSYPHPGPGHLPTPESDWVRANTPIDVVPPRAAPPDWRAMNERVDLGKQYIDEKYRTPFLIHGPHTPPPDLGEWARKNTPTGPLPFVPPPESDWRAMNERVVIPMEEATKRTINTGSKAYAAGARLRVVGQELKAASMGLGRSLAGFVEGIGPIGLAFAGFIIGDEILRALHGAKDAVDKQNQSLDAVPHSIVDLRTRAQDARDAASGGAQHGFWYRAADLSRGGAAGHWLRRQLQTDTPSEEQQQTAADQARANADQALINARRDTRGSKIQNVGLANKEIVSIARREATQAVAWGHSRAEVNAAFDRYVRDVGVSIEGISTGKTDPKVIVAIQALRDQAMEAFGATKDDPFAQFRAGLAEAVDFMGTLSTRAGTFGSSAKDLKTLQRGALFVTATYGQSRSKDDIAKVADAQKQVDDYIKNMVNDLNAANRVVQDRGAEVPLTARQLTPGALRAGMRYVQSGTDSNYERTLKDLRTARDSTYDGMGRVMEGLRKQQRLVAEGESLRNAPVSERIKAFVGPDHVPLGSAALDKWIAEHRRALRNEKAKVNGASKAAAKRAQQIQAEIDAVEEQRYQDTTSNIKTRVAYAQSTASDKSGAIRSQLQGDAELVKAALAYHGPGRWAKIMEALTQQNNDIAAQAQQNLADIQGQTDLSVSQVTGVSKADDARRLQIQLAGARQALASARAEAPNPGKKDDIRNAEIAVNNIMHQINEAAVSDTKDAHDLARDLYDSRMAIRMAGITDPLKTDRLQVEQDVHDLSFIKRGDFKSQAEFQIARNNQIAKIRGDRSKLRQDEISGDYEDAQFQHNIGKMTDDAYLSQLRKIVHMKGISKQMRRQLLEEIYRQTHSDTGGVDLNVGSIRLPSIYEVRRAMRQGHAAVARQTSITNAPTFNLHVHRREDIPGVGQVIEDATNGAVMANLRAAGAI